MSHASQNGSFPTFRAEIQNRRNSHELGDGTLISEATAITEYLDNIDGKPSLTGKTIKEKAVVHMMQRRAEAFVLDPVGIYFHFGTPGLGPTLQEYKSPDWVGRKDWAERNRAAVLEGFKYFEKVLATSDFVAGDFFSMADITLYAGLAFGDAAGVHVGPENPSLLAWRGRVSELPSVKNRTGQEFLPEDAKRLGL